jgi:tetratricopeptide (TPR) repeat protein
MADDTRDYERTGYLGLLNDEAIHGERAARALLAAGPAREALLEANPDWLRVGTLETLIEHARECLDSNPLEALEITTFVLRHVDRIPPPSPDTEFLVSELQGTAWKEHGNALFMLSRLDEALNAANRAVEIFSADPFHVAYRASALVLVALILHALGRNEEAAAVIEEARPVLAEHHDAVGHLASTQVGAMIVFDEEHYQDAYDLYLRALDEAVHIGDEREQARIHQNLGACALRMGQIGVASDHLDQAFLGFTRQRMHGELQRAIWLTASIARERNSLPEALFALHNVHARFLERGMIAEAAKVLIDIGGVMTELTGDVSYGKDVCARLAASLGEHDVPESVRAAIEDLRDASVRTDSVEGLREALRRAAAFLSEFLGSRPPALNQG